MKITASLVMLFAFAQLFCSCLKNNNPQPSVDNSTPSCTDTSHGYFAKINGLCFSTPQYNFSRDINGVVDLLVYADSLSTTVAFEFKMDTVYTGATFTLDGSRNLGSFINGSYYYISKTGSITITKYDRPNNKISATFSFVGYNTLNPSDKVPITEGYFRNAPIRK